MRVFITGMNGFAGEHLTRHLLAAGDSVAGCTRFGELTGIDPAVEFAVGWNLGQRSLAAATRQQIQAFAPDWIFHLAAISIPSRCGKLKPTPEAVRSNVEGTRELLELAATLPGKPRVVFISSSHVYGAVTAEDPFCNEERLLAPISGYGKTKVAAEQLVREAVQAGTIDGVIARAFHHSGPGQLPPGLLPSWTQQLLDPQVSEMHVVTLAAHLNISDVRDMAAAYRLLAEKGHSGQAYNVGSPRGYSCHEIMQQLMQVAGITKPVVEELATGRQNPLADCSKIKEHTGWEATFSLTQTLQDTVEYWRT